MRDGKELSKCDTDKVTRTCGIIKLVSVQLAGGEKSCICSWKLPNGYACVILDLRRRPQGLYQA